MLPVLPAIPRVTRNANRFRPRLEELEDRLVLDPPGAGWQRLFADEFNGNTLNTGIWSRATGARRDAVNTANAVSVGGGNLTLTTYTQGSTHYTGFVGSYAGFFATYGYYEARIRFQSTSGMWSAFWIQSPTIGNPLGNPGVAGTEIDIVEHRARDVPGADLRNRASMNLHWDGYGQSHRTTGTTVNNPSGTPLQGNFHTYAVQWSPSGYQFFIDGTQVWSTTQAIARRSEFLYLTSEVQHNAWAGPIPGGGYGSLATSQTKMIVDWVRVWQRPVADVANQATTDGRATAAVPVTVTQRDGQTTTVSATSSTAALVPNGNLTLGGGGANRTVTVRPLAGQTGTATITLAANNGTVSGSDTFVLTVHAGSFRNAGFEEDAAGTGWNRYGGAALTSTGQRSGGRALRIAGYGGAEQTITGLSPNTTYTLGGYARVTQAGVSARIGVKNHGNAERYATITNTPYTRTSLTFRTGPAATQATVYGFKPTATADGYFDDLYVFRSPTITPILDQAIDEDTATEPLLFDLDRVTGPFTVTAMSSNTKLVPHENLVLGGGGRNWTLTAMPAAERFGTTAITVRASDPHGGSVETSFLLTVHPVREPPVSLPIVDLTPLIPPGRNPSPLGFHDSGESNRDRFRPVGNVGTNRWPNSRRPQDTTTGRNGVATRGVDDRRITDRTDGLISDLVVDMRAAERQAADTKSLQAASEKGSAHAAPGPQGGARHLSRASRLTQ